MNNRPKRRYPCPGSNRTVAAPATSLGFEEKCPECERYLVPIKKYGEWQVRSHYPLKRKDSE